MSYEIIIGQNRILELQTTQGAKTWPAFMQQDPIVNEHWPRLYTDFLPFQFALCEDKHCIGIGNAVPVNWQHAFDALPGAGVDWAMVKSKEDHSNGLDANLLIGIQILINKNYQNQGMSYEMLRIMKKIAQSNGIKQLAIPVRPTLKYKYPLIPMQDYVSWQNQAGEAFDPWIRVHIKAGGTLLSVCDRSMDISGSVSDWESWSGLALPASGNYVIDKALVPVAVDKNKNEGRYVEPNVWILHQAE